MTLQNRVLAQNGCSTREIEDIFRGRDDIRRKKKDHWKNKNDLK